MTLYEKLKFYGNGWKTEHEIAWLRMLRNDVFVSYARSLSKRTRWGKIDAVDVVNAVRKEAKRRAIVTMIDYVSTDGDLHPFFPGVRVA